MSGGFLPGPVALGAAALALALVGWITLAEQPWRALSGGYVAVAACLALLAAWTIASATWSDAAARAVVEYDRVLLYLLGFVLVGAIGRTPERLRWVVRGVALAAFATSLCGLVTRLAPDMWAIDAVLAEGRLSYPLGYWNALGLLAAVGMIMSLALTSDDREAPVVRVLAAATVPVLTATLLLTFSRGAMAVGIAGLVALIMAGRPRALLSGLLVAVPAAAVAAVSAYGADLLASSDPTSAAATAQGHDVAVVVGLVTALAAVLRTVLLALDRRMQRVALPARLRRPAVAWPAIGVLAAVGVAAAVSLGAPDAISRQYDRFVEGDAVGGVDGDLRGRLANPGNNGRIDQWRVAVDVFAREPLRGGGAGTYALDWERHRSATYQVEDAHSLYAEILGELGVVGFVLVLGAILLVLAGFAARARGPDRVVGGALFGAGLAWVLHAGIDWHWEMPVVTFWFFAAGGLALAAPARDAASPRTGTIGRTLVALGCLLLALVPARVFLSEAPLRDSARAFAAGDCATAIDRALDSTAAFALRPEPFIVLGYCDVRLGQTDLALGAMRNAVRKDPGNWEGHYGLALVQAVARQDPRPELRIARQLNPREPLVADTARLLGDDPRAWQRRALRARLPID